MTEGEQVDYNVLLKDIKSVDEFFSEGQHSFQAVLNQLLLVNFAVIEETGGESEETGFLNSEVSKQGKKISKTLKKSYETSDMARRAALNLREQRD